MGVTIPTGTGCMAHLFVVYGNQGAEEDAERLSLTNKLLTAVLAEAQVVCVGQPVLIVGNFHADPGIIPGLARGISSGRFVDLALAHLVGAGVEPGMNCKFKLDECAGSRRDSVVACPNALAASISCGSLLIFLSSAVNCGGLTDKLLNAVLAEAQVVRGLPVYIGRSALQVRQGRLGGRASGGHVAGRLYRVSRSDELDVSSAQYFANSSLATVLLLRLSRMFFKGIRRSGFSQAKWVALCDRWCCLSSASLWALEPWVHWIPQICTVFTSGSLTLLRFLMCFVRRVVTSRRDAGLCDWARRLHEDLGARPYHWLRADIVLPSPCLVVKD